MNIWIIPAALVFGGFLGTVAFFALRRCNNGGEEEEFNVCERHGHDYRDEPRKKEWTASFSEARWSHATIWRGIERSDLPGTPLGFWELEKAGKIPCRDCGKKKGWSEIIKSRSVFFDPSNEEIVTLPEDELVALQEGEE